MALSNTRSTDCRSSERDHRPPFGRAWILWVASEETGELTVARKAELLGAPYSCGHGLVTDSLGWLGIGRDASNEW